MVVWGLLSAGRLRNTKSQPGLIVRMLLSRETPVQRSNWAYFFFQLLVCIKAIGVCVCGSVTHYCLSVSVSMCLVAYSRKWIPKDEYFQNMSLWMEREKGARRPWVFVGIGWWGPLGMGQISNEQPSEAFIHLEHGPLQLPWHWLWSTKMLDPHHSPRATSLPSGQHTCICIHSMCTHRYICMYTYAAPDTHAHMSMQV